MYYAARALDILGTMRTVRLGSTNSLCLCLDLHGGTRSLMSKKGSVSYIVPGCNYDAEAL